jgi:hypothetical protein
LDVACTRYATFLPRCSPKPISDKFSKKWGFRLSHTHKPRKMANLGRPYRMFSQPGGGHPNGGGGGSAGAIRSPPRPNHEAATTRPSPRLTLEGCNGRRPRVELRREYGAAVRSNGARRCPGPRGGRHNGRKPLPARSRRRYPSPGTGWAPSIWEIPYWSGLIPVEVSL